MVVQSVSVTTIYSCEFESRSLQGVLDIVSILYLQIILIANLKHIVESFLLFRMCPELEQHSGCISLDCSEHVPNIPCALGQ